MDLTPSEFGRLCALATAFAWACALVLLRPSGVHVPPLALNLFKNTVGLVLLMVTIVLQGDLGLCRGFAWGDVVVVAISGVLGLAVADTLFFHSLNRLGVGLVAIIECLYSPCVLLFSAVLLHEVLTGWHILGMVCITLGILVASRHREPQGVARATVVAGFAYGTASIVCMTYAIVWAKPAIEAMPLIWGTTIRLGAGTLSLAVVVLFRRRTRAGLAVFRPSRLWVLVLPSSILAAYLCLILWMAGFKYASASDAGILNQTSTIFALILATIFLKERFTVRKTIAVALAVGGVVMTLQRWWSWPPWGSAALHFGDGSAM